MNENNEIITMEDEKVASIAVLFRNTVTNGCCLISF